MCLPAVLDATLIGLTLFETVVALGAFFGLWYVYAESSDD